MSKNDEVALLPKEDLDFLRRLAEMGEQWGKNVDAESFVAFLAEREAAAAMAEETAQAIDAKATAYLGAVVYLKDKILKSDPAYDWVYLMLQDQLPGQKPSRRSRRGRGL